MTLNPSVPALAFTFTVFHFPLSPPSPTKTTTFYVQSPKQSKIPRTNTTMITLRTQDSGASSLPLRRATSPTSSPSILSPSPLPPSSPSSTTSHRDPPFATRSIPTAPCFTSSTSTECYPKHTPFFPSSFREKDPTPLLPFSLPFSAPCLSVTTPLA